MNKKKATIYEVASTAGVSIQTVSRVLNAHPYVSDKTRQRVLEAISQLDYRPDAIARTLTNGRSYTLGVLAAEVSLYGPQRMLNGIEKQSAALGYSLLLSIIHHHDVHNISRLLDNLLSHQVDGIIWTGAGIDSNLEWIHAKLRQIPVPVMFVSRQVSRNLATVYSDSRAGARMATEHLVAQGYRHIGLITGPLIDSVVRERQLGWQDALTVAGLPIESRRTVEGDWTPASGMRGLHQLLKQFPEMDAVFASNDQMALGVLQAAHRLGRRVPEDLGVVGYDATPEAEYYWPPLTTVWQHLIEIGSTAVREVIRLVELKQQGENVTQPPHIVIQPQLIVRESSTRV
jgi:DNA-binding LacI/PurR family transcriptional regulator